MESWRSLLQYYLSNPGGFSVLVLGPRGIGKTSTIARSVRAQKGGPPTPLRSSGGKAESDTASPPFIEFNCAAFEDHLAESTLFGYASGAFTGGQKGGAQGLFKAADNGVLLFDEVHALSKRVQQKLMTTLQTEPEGKNQGKFPILRLGATARDHVKVRPVFATNVSLTELRTTLLPDFYDRISQLVVEVPTMPKNAKHLRKTFQTIWDKMDFKYETKNPKDPLRSNPCPNSKAFMDRLKGQPLEGNYRDLDTIAILWDQAYRMDLSDSDSLKFVQEHFDGWHGMARTAKRSSKPVVRRAAAEAAQARRRQGHNQCKRKTSGRVHGHHHYQDSEDQDRWLDRLRAAEENIHGAEARAFWTQRGQLQGDASDDHGVQELAKRHSPSRSTSARIRGRIQLPVQPKFHTRERVPELARQDGRLRAPSVQNHRSWLNA